MSVYILTVNSVEQPLKLGTLSLQSVVIGRTVMSCSIRSTAGAYRPALNDAVELTEDGSTIFVGLIRQTEERGEDGQPLADIETRITCDSLAVLAERRYITTLTVSAGDTLKDALLQVDADDYLADFGLNLDAAQVTGPTLTEDIVADGWKLSEFFKTLSTLTGYLPEYESTEWRFYDPSSRSAPVNIVDGDGHHVGDITVERTRDKYVDRVIARGGQPPNRPTTDTFTGDGTTASFTLTYPIAGPIPYSANGAVGQAVVYIDGATEALGGASSGLQWTYDPTTQQITRTAGAPALSAAISIGYDVQYPITVVVETSPPGFYESVLTYPDVYDKALLTALAQQALADGQDIITRVQLDSHEPGLMPGQTLTITAADRDIDGTFMITEVGIRTEPATDIVRRSIKAIEGDRFKGSFRDLIIAWLGGGQQSSGGATSSSSGPASSGAGGVPAPPNRAVQHHANGAFGGSSELLQDYDGGGATYGVTDLPAILASMITSGKVAAAFGHATAGPTKALTINCDSSGNAYVELDNGGTLALFVYGGGDWQGGGVNVELTDNAWNSNAACRILLRKRVALASAFLNVQRKTSSFTVDTAFASGGLPETLVLLDASTGTPVVTLPAVTHHAITVSTVYGRCVWFRNIGSVDWALTPASGNIDGTSSYNLPAGNAAMVIASNASGAAGWWVMGVK